MFGQDGQKLDKPGARLDVHAALEIRDDARFVSRGGEKLEAALESFPVCVEAAIAIDVGASTGGFTDCLLQRGAARVYAVDVGQGQFAWKLRHDPRVVLLERTNARDLAPAKLPPPFAAAHLVAIDCSFISLRKILPAAVSLLGPGGKIVALIKPQFEAGKTEADRGAGVIRDAAIHERVVHELQEFAAARLGARWRGVTESPLLGPAGNKEFLALMETP